MSKRDFEIAKIKAETQTWFLQQIEAHHLSTVEAWSVVHELNAMLIRLAKSEEQSSAVTQTTCDECGVGISNITGWYIMRKNGEPVHTCARCRDCLLAKGWTLVAEAK